jgi:hypothetical protein
MNVAARKSLIKPLGQLYPLPGCKADPKYSILTPDPSHVAICQPFMGSAARSLGSHLPSYLGDINAAQRSISWAWKHPAEFVAAYNAERDRLLNGINPEDTVRIDPKLLAPYENQGPLKADHPEIFALIKTRWDAMQSDIFAEINNESIGLAGRYYFQLKAAFGQVMRLNPKGTDFNSSWHIDKLNAAIKFSPLNWCMAMAATPFDAQIYDCWEKAIEEPPDPANTLLILDPPYGVDTDKSKITACYLGHQISSNGQDDTLLDLAIEPLNRAISLGYRTIYLCNYRSDKLEEAIAQLCDGYTVTRHDFGECRSLGNSAGRLSHGKRKDNRDRGSEAIWEIRKKKHRRAVDSLCFSSDQTHIDSQIFLCASEINQLQSEGVARGSLSSSARSSGTTRQSYFYPAGGGRAVYVPVNAVAAMAADIARGDRAVKVERAISLLEQARQLLSE